MHPTAARISSMADVAQRTPEWYEARRKLITASDAAAALSIKPFKSYAGDPREDCLLKKLDNHPFSNIFVRHGQKYEDEAVAYFEQFVGEKVFEKGLVIHPTEPWIGASPDGICEKSGRLLEIKCPIQRAIIPGGIPHHYYPQVQVQMEVLNADACYFVQYKPAHLTQDMVPFADVVCIPRDTEWWASNRETLYSFWKEYQERLETHVPNAPPPPPTCKIVDTLY